MGNWVGSGGGGGVNGWAMMDGMDGRYTFFL